MRQLGVWLALATCLVVALVAVPGPAAEKKVDETALKKLIEQLGSEDFSVRQSAQKELEALGLPAYEALKKAAAEASDPEIAMRTLALVEKLEKQVVSARILTPTKVHLKFKDTPLKDALAELNKKADCKIGLYDPDNTLKDQKITLDTGEVSFWEAFDQFCDKAGLVETSAVEVIQAQQQKPGGARQPGGARPGGVIRVRPGAIRVLPAQPAQPPKVDAPPREDAKPVEKEPKKDEDKPAKGEGVRQQQLAEVAFVEQVELPVVAQPVQVQVRPGVGLPGGIAVPDIPVLDLSSQVILKPGKPVKQATAYSGSFRLRTLAEPAKLFGNPDPKELLIGLQVSAEPRLTIQGIQEVRITKAIDDQDQALKAPVIKDELDALPIGAAVRGRAILRIAPGMPGLQSAESSTVPVKIVRGAKESKSLKELSGTVEALVLTQPEAMLEAADVRKAGGKSFTGKEGGTMMVLAVNENNGTFSIRVEVDPPKNALTPGGADQWNNPWGGWNGAIQLGGAQGGGIAMTALQSNYGFNLHDAKGTVIPHTGVNVNGVVASTGQVLTQYTINYKLAKDQTPGKLVWSGQRQAVIDIPFTLKDVPLK